MSGMGRITQWLQRQKDSSCSFLAERTLQSVVAPYGRLLNLSIDSREKSLRLEVLPKGEAEAITITLEHYEVLSEPDGVYLVVQKASASREWLSILLGELMPGRRVRLPDKYSAGLRLIL